MSNTLIINNVDYSDMFKFMNYDFNTVRTYSEPTNNNIFTKVGKLAGKTTRFFQKTETKIVSLTAFWCVESVIYMTLATLAAGSLLALTLMTSWYLYETYVIWSAIEALTK